MQGAKTKFNSAVEHGSTGNKLSRLFALGAKRDTVWGVVRPSRNKAWRSGKCSRCPSERDTTGWYCRACRTAYAKRWRAKKRRAAA